MEEMNCKCGGKKSRCVIYGNVIARICSNCGYLHYMMTLEDYAIEVLNASDDWKNKFIDKCRTEVLS